MQSAGNTAENTAGKSAENTAENTAGKSAENTARKSAENTAGEKPGVIAIPLQADLFRSIGENFRGATLPTTATFALTWGQYLKEESQGRKRRNPSMVYDYGKP